MTKNPADAANEHLSGEPRRRRGGRTTPKKERVVLRMPAHAGHEENDPNSPFVPIVDNDGNATGEMFTFASARKALDIHQVAAGEADPATPPVDPTLATTITPFTWNEKNPEDPEGPPVVHVGTEYQFPPETGLPNLRTEWIPRTDGESYGVGVLFMATATPETGGGPNDFSDWDGATDHPDNEQHYRDTLFEPWNLLFPDLSSADDPATETTITVDDVVVEAVRRYFNWLSNIHPSQLQQLLEAATNLSSQIMALATTHLEIHNQIKKIDGAAVIPGISPELVARIAKDDPTLVGGTDSE